MYIIIIMLNYKGSCGLSSCVLSSCVIYTFLYTPELLGQFVIRLALCDVMFHLEMIEKVGHLGFNGRCIFYVFVNRQEVVCTQCMYTPLSPGLIIAAIANTVCMFIDQYMQTRKAVYWENVKLLQVQHLCRLAIWLFA